VLRVLIVFNADTDPAFYLDADPDTGRKNNAGSGSWSDFAGTKIGF
jgi:hypothetical protein